MIMVGRWTPRSFLPPFCLCNMFVRVLALLRNQPVLLPPPSSFRSATGKKGRWRSGTLPMTDLLSWKPIVQGSLVLRFEMLLVFTGFAGNRAYPRLVLVKPGVLQNGHRRVIVPYATSPTCSRSRQKSCVRPTSYNLVWLYI